MLLGIVVSPRLLRMLPGRTYNAKTSAHHGVYVVDRIYSVSRFVHRFVAILFAVGPPVGRFPVHTCTRSLLMRRLWHPLVAVYLGLASNLGWDDDATRSSSTASRLRGGDGLVGQLLPAGQVLAYPPDGLRDPGEGHRLVPHPSGSHLRLKLPSGLLSRAEKLHALSDLLPGPSVPLPQLISRFKINSASYTRMERD